MKPARRFALAFAVGLGLTALAHRANAQAPSGSGAGASDVVMPKLVTDSPARYPEQALKDRVTGKVTVNLILELDANGRVKTATATEPQGHGFDEAAASAASLLVFSPATRGGTAIAAKIRFAYTFEPPAGRVSGKILRATSDTPLAGATIVLTDVNGETRTLTAGADGTYRFENVPPGKVHIHAEAAKRVPQEIDEDVGPGEEAEVLVRLDLPPEAPPPPAAGGTAAAAEPVEEVRVKGEKPPREVTKRTIPREEIAVIPGTNGDALRSLQNLPGVARPPPFGGQLVVRGSAPQDTQYFVDGTNIPLVYHFGGLSSVLPTEVLDKIDFYPGNFSTQYGRGMGGIVDIGVRGPHDDGRTHAMVQIDLIDARFVAERSLGHGWSFLLGGRRSYFDLWLGPILKSSSGVSTTPRYYDYQVMLKKEFSKDHELRFFFFGSDDRLEIFSSNLSGDFALGGSLRDATTFWRIQARYFNKIDDKTRITAVAAFGEDYLNFGIGTNYLQLTSWPLSGRGELQRKITKKVTANVGIDILDSPFDISVRFPRPTRPGVPDSGLNQPNINQVTNGATYLPAAYAEFELVPWRGARIVPGLRVDYLKFTEAQAQTSGWDVSPRITVRQDLTTTGPKTTFKAGAGLFFQPPQPQEMDFVFGKQNLKSNRAQHYTVGLEQEVGTHVSLSVEGFYKALDRLVVQDLGNTGEGFVYGSEWLLRYQKDPKMFGWIAYTLMRSERRDDPSETYHLFQYDQTHILTALFHRELPDGWGVGSRFRLVSGNLYTPQNLGAVDLDRNVYNPVLSTPLFGSRLGMFQQLDIRIDKALIAKPLKLSIYLDVQNVYYHRSQEGVSYNFDFTQSAPVQGLPILPILGIRGENL